MAKVEMQAEVSVYDTIKTLKDVLLPGEMFDDQNHAIVMATQNLGGHWLKYGTKLVMADRTGHFVLSGVTGNEKVNVVHDPSFDPEFSFQSNQLSPSTTRDILIAFVHDGFSAMPEGVPPGMSAAGAVASCCSGSSGVTMRPAASTSCLDYDGPLGDGVRYPHTPSNYLKVYRNYVNSTCWGFVDSGLCTNEGATITNQLSGAGGPSCYNNHKYRFCQDVGKTFTITPTSKTVKDGDSVDLEVENSTAGNETSLSLDGPGSISTQLLKHYDDGAQEHQDKQSFSYSASLPSGQDSATATITGESNGQTVTATITITKHDQGGNFKKKG